MAGIVENIIFKYLNTHSWLAINICVRIYVVLIKILCVGIFIKFHWDKAGIAFEIRNSILYKESWKNLFLQLIQELIVNIKKKKNYEFYIKPIAFAKSTQYI